MFCPHCHTEYDAHTSCFCHPARTQSMSAEEKQDPATCHKPEPPAGLDNPFWKPEGEGPITFPGETGTRKGGTRPGLSA